MTGPYTTLIADAATTCGHLNVFKHEFGHSITEYYDAAGTAPKRQPDPELDLQQTTQGSLTTTTREPRRSPRTLNDAWESPTTHGAAGVR